MTKFMPPENPGGVVGIGAAPRRKEDMKFLLGTGRFIDDFDFPGALTAVIVRSPHAHAEILSTNVSAALKLSGVAAVLTGADMEADDVGPMTPLWAITSFDGTAMAEPKRWALARDRVRHVGEPVALVVAETKAQAMDAAEAVSVDYTVLPAVTRTSDAGTADAPQLHEEASANQCFDWRRGDPDAVDAAFEAAPHVVTFDAVNNRLAGAAIETRGVVGSPDAASGGITLYSTTQAPHHIRRAVAGELGMTESKLRVISPDVGGGFGVKGKHYPEETIMAWAARRLNRTVKWIGGRDEAFISDTQGRDHVSQTELAVAEDGTFLALRVNTTANLGAYVSTFGANIPSAIYSALLAGIYKTPAIAIRVTGVFTNTVPTDAYRGAGRPEACYLLEGLAEQAARKLGLDPLTIRRKNLIQADDMPYTTPIGPTYDSGDFPNILNRVTEMSDFDGFRRANLAPTNTGCLKGIGVACFVETSGVAPSGMGAALGARVGFYESAQIRVDPDGGIIASLGTHNHGQGHATTFAQIISDRLGVPLDDIEIIEGDTAVVPAGTGTFGSRSIAVGGSAIDRAALKIVEKGKKISAHMLEAAAGDIVFEDGKFTVAGTDRSLAFQEIAHAAHVPQNFPLQELEPGLDETAFYDPTNFAFSNGGHVCAVEVDTDTGAVTITGYWVVDDVGTVINPLVVEGQVHGGLAQGIGQVLMENCAYDPENGQMVAGSYMDYAMPRADDLPSFVSVLDESQPCTHNPLGAKGCGESGTIAAPPAVMSAILNALEPLGVTDIEMPATPERVWQAIQAGAP